MTDQPDKDKTQDRLRHASTADASLAASTTLPSQHCLGRPRAADQALPQALLRSAWERWHRFGQKMRWAYGPPKRRAEADDTVPSALLRG